MVTERALDRAERQVGELLEEYAGAASVDLSAWRDDPVGMARELGRDPVDYQADVLRSLVSNRFTVWRGCHSCGKEHTAGTAAVWGAAVRGMLVLVISATEGQAVGQTMREVGNAFKAAARTWGIGFKRFRRSIRIGGEDRVIALTGSADVDALTGWHDPNGVLVLISEGQGERLEDVAYDAALSNANTERCRVAAFGNPVRPTGRFYEINRSSQWQTFQTGAFDTPNVQAGETVLPGFPAPGWPQEMAREYGRESPFYVGRVLGEFPESSEDSLVRRSWLDRATRRHREADLDYWADGADVVVGVDPARHGPDATAVAIRQGNVVREIRTWRGQDSTTDTVDRLRELLAEITGRDRPRVSAVVVDEIGVGGGVKDGLEAALRGLTFAHEPANRGPYRPARTESPVEVVGFNSSRSAADATRFLNLRAASYWAVRERLESGELLVPDDPELVEELAALRWQVTGAGAIQIEAKTDLRGRLGRSPDRADALAMSFARSVTPQTKRVRVR